MICGFVTLFLVLATAISMYSREITAQQFGMRAAECTKTKFNGKVVRSTNKTGRSVPECCGIFSDFKAAHDIFWFDPIQKLCIMAKTNPGKGIIVIPDYVYTLEHHNIRGGGSSGWHKKPHPNHPFKFQSRK